MNTYIILLRGINVGGKNKIPMSELRNVLEEAGFHNVSTYIASGNVILQSDKNVQQIKKEVEELLPLSFELDSEFIKVLVLTISDLQKIVEDKPQGFGESPHAYHSDVVFLIDTSSNEIVDAFTLREGVDTLWKGSGVIYFQRLSSQRTKSKLGKIITSPLYKSLTIRNWNTTTKLLQLAKDK